MEQLRNDGGAVRSLDEREHLERTRAMFERKAGRPVSAVEAREWLDSLVGFYRRIERWVIEDAAEQAAMERRQEIQRDAREPGRDSSRDTQGLPPESASRRLPAQRKTRASTRNSTRNTRNVHKGVQIERTTRTGQE
jgi:hypothetical protein